MRELDDEVEELVISEEDMLPHNPLPVTNDEALDQLLCQAAEVITTPEVSDPSTDTAEAATHSSPTSHSPQDVPPLIATAETSAV